LRTSRLLFRVKHKSPRAISADDQWVTSDPGPDLVQDEVQSVLLELDVSKGVGPDGIPPIILKNCASFFVRSLSLLFRLSLQIIIDMCFS
jgi:hypothetical protein